MTSAKQIAQGLFGEIEWVNAEHGFCICPGQSFHTRPNKNKDCQIFLSGVPSVFCFHSSCHAEVDRANHALRSAIGKMLARTTGSTRPRRLSTAEIAKRRERAAFERLKNRAENSLVEILSQFACDPADIFEQSPVRLLDDPADDWRLLLRLFKTDDVVWIGDIYDSGKGHEGHFQHVSTWLTQTKAPSPLICPNTFIPGTISRSNSTVQERRFLVIESDNLTKPQIAAVFYWTRQFLRLRAIVDTAGKSLHGWFEFPKNTEVEKELKIILPALGCDPALFKPSQPCRLPGANRNDKTQALLWLDLRN